MKRYIVITILLLVSLSAFSQKVVNQSIYNVDSFIEHSIEYLGLSGEGFFLIIQEKPTKSVGPGFLIYNKNPNNKVFNLYISNSLTWENFLKVLGHELVHVKQLVNNEIPIKEVAAYNYKYDKYLKYSIKFEDEANEVSSKLVGLFKHKR